MGTKSDKIIIYIPDRILRMGFLEGWREMFNNLFQCRELIWRLFLRDFNARYRQSILGVSWAILNPVIIVGVFVFLNRAGIINIEETKVPYPVFALMGITIYGLFSTGLSASTNSIVGAGSMVTKINFPKISLVVSSFAHSLVEFTVRMALLVGVFIIFGITPKGGSILFPLAVFPILLLSLGLGFFLSLLAGIFRDIIHAVSLVTTFLLLLTPVLYPQPEGGIFVLISKWNPLTHLITGCRDLILSGNMSNQAGFLWSSIFSAILFLMSWRVFYLAETKIAERI